MRFVALLRGINVGGKNVIKMAELKACFESIGLSDVTTFIQSGNVFFGTDERSIAKMTEKVEEGLSKCFDYNSRVVIVSHEQLKNAVKHAPSGFGRKPAKYRYDVVFLRKPLSPAEAMKSVTAKDGIDEAFAGTDVLYFSKLIKKASQSRLPRLIAKPVYQDMTIRNWKTTTKLLALMDTGSLEY